LKAYRVGLWDAYRSCVRPGSMDKDITEKQLNDFSILRSLAQNISLICFNGQGGG
jgi:G:T/U-mismatch repair DNA glycosylase